MNPNNLIRAAAVAALCLAVVPQGAAQTTTIVANPSSLTFNLTAGTPPQQTVSLALSNGQGGQFARITPSTGLTLRGLPSLSVILPATVSVGVEPVLLPASTFQGTIRVEVVGVAPLTIPVCFIRTSGSGQCPGSGTTGTFFANTSSLSFNQIDSFPPGAQQIGLSSTLGFIPTYSTSLTYNTPLQNWLQISPAPGTLANSQIVTVTPVTTGLPTGTYTATLNIVASGYNTISIPITLSIGTGSGTTGFYASPSSVNFTYPVGTTNPLTQFVTINAATVTTFSVSVSSNLAGVLQVSPALGNAPTQLSVTLQTPSLVPANTSGSITVTPSVGSPYPAISIPVQVNVSGTGNSSVAVNPAALTFSTVPGVAPPLQLLNVTSTDGATHTFSVSVNSPTGFLTASASSIQTPATITVGIVGSAVTQVGTYNGNILVTPSTGIGAGVPVTVPVTLNVGTTGVILATPTSLALEARAGASPVTANVRLDVAAGVSAMAYTTAVTTASGGNWLSAPSTGVAPGQITVSANPASLAPGNYTGRVTVTPTNAAAFDITVTFNVTASGELRVSPATLSFAHQTTSSSAPATQTVNITSTGTPLTWNATATSTGNWLQISPATGTTGTNNLTVSVNPTGLAAGSYSGSVSVSSPNATNPALTVPVTLTVTTPLIPAISAFVNAASFAPTAASPGLIATITGTNLGPATGVSGSPGGTGFPTTLGETQVLFDGRPAPLLYSSATQVSAIAPFELAGRLNTRVQVVYRDQRSSELELRVVDAAPGVFTLSQGGSGQGAVLNQNGTVNGPNNPERRGNVVVIYATGLGMVFPPVPTGTLASAASQTALQVRVRIGGVDARVLYSGAAPGLVGGGYQVNAVIPEGVTPGSAVPVSVEAGPALSQPTATIAVQ